MQPEERPVVPKEYAGLWIAWSSDHQRIVASGKTWKEARAAANAAGEPDAILGKAPSKPRAPAVRLQRLSPGKQKRLDLLMAKNNDGQATPTERRELRSLVREAETVALNNARALASGRPQRSPA